MTHRPRRWLAGLREEPMLGACVLSIFLRGFDPSSAFRAALVLALVGSFGLSCGGEDDSSLADASDAHFAFQDLLNPRLDVASDLNRPAEDLQLHANVHVLDDSSPFHFVGTETDGTVVIGANEGAVLSPGDILVSDPAHGKLFGRIATSKKVGGEYRVTLELPQLDEVVKEGHFHFKAPVEFNGAALTGALSGNVEFVAGGKADAYSLPVMKVDLSGEDLFAETIQNDLGEPVEVHVWVKEGALIVQPVVEFDYDIGVFSGLESLLLALDVQTSLDLVVGMEISGRLIDYKLDQDPFITIEPPSIPLGFWGWLDVGAEFSWVLEVDMEGSLSAWGGLESSLTVTIGASYDDGEWAPIAEKSHSFTSIGPDLHGAFSFGALAGVRSEFFVEPYGLVGPRFSLEPYLKYLVEGEGPPLKLLWELLFGIRSEIGIKGHVFDIDLFEYYTELFDWHTTVAKGEVVPDLCGNGECDDGEDCSACPVDCGSCCGDGTCASAEDCSTCPADCECNDGFQCMEGECHPATCIPDCSGKECGDGGCPGIPDACGVCSDDESCLGGKCEQECTPDCDGKECGDDGCDGSCGACDDGWFCQAGGCVEDPCLPDCEGKECGGDGCGGLCNDCLDIVYDDGSTETAYGYASQPEFNPQRIACVVRFELPLPDMRLTRFTAGWMYGLYNLQIPFELAYIPGDAMECEDGTEQSWYNEYCETTPDLLVSIGDFLPSKPFEPMESEQLGEVIFPTKTIYLAAIFDVDEYPIFVCPMDQSGDGSLSYMMPQTEKTPGIVIGGASFDKKDGNAGVIPFSIRVEKTNW